MSGFPAVITEKTQTSIGSGATDAPQRLLRRYDRLVDRVQECREAGWKHFFKKVKWMLIFN